MKGWLSFVLCRPRKALSRQKSVIFHVTWQGWHYSNPVPTMALPHRTSSWGARYVADCTVSSHL